MAQKSNTTISTGKKKSAVARAYIKPGKGEVKVNSAPLELWGSKYERDLILEPVNLLPDLVKGLSISINVNGGGSVSQAVAARVAVARALVEHSKDKETRNTLLSYDDKLLAGDTRQREPNKPGRSSPRARRQKSYR